MMNNSEKTILVAGATGRQGGAVLHHLLRNNFKVRALSRTPESVSSKLLSSKGISVIKGDMSDIPSLVAAMKGCTGVFSVQNYFEYGGEKEILYGKNMVDAAKKSDIQHFVYNSVSGAESNSGVPHFETKNTIEQYIKNAGIAHTIFRPVKFMENYYIPQVFKGILGGKLFDSIKSGKKHQIIAADDIGKYVSEAFLHHENYLNRTFEISGDELTNEQIAATITDVLGMKIKFKLLPLLAVKVLMDREMYLMFKWFNEKGFNVSMEETKKEFPSVKVTTFKEFLLAENWQRWNKKGSV